MYEMEKKQWTNVLERLVEIVKFLGAQNLAFRGSSDTLYEKDNGKFLKLIELFAKFDPVMECHIQRAMQKKGCVHYLSKDSQNEISQILGNGIRSKILLSLKNAKYYSLLLDCTPDASKTEQMSVIIRFVLFNSGNVEIKEHFLGFLKVDDTRGSGLYETVIEMLGKLNIPIQDMRGQGYDNGANMKGKRNGLQNMLLRTNPRAFYVPCAAHTLNLMVNDAAKVNTDTINFFSIVQELYNFFSSSPKRWTVLLKNITQFTLKQPSNTRWESRIEAIRPLRYQLGEVYDALYEIVTDENFNKEVQHEAHSLCIKIKDYKFICTLIIWHDLLNRINPVSKQLQDKSMDVKLAMEAIENLKSFVTNYRSNSNFKDLLETAKNLSQDVDGEMCFKSITEVRRRKKTCQFQYEHCDETPQTPEDRFRITVFYTVLDTAWASLNERFELLKSHYEQFSFLHDISTISNEKLRKKCDDLENLLKNDDNKDINAIELYDEILAYKDIFGNCKSNIQNPFNILQFLVSNNLTFPNLTIALRIFLTMPVSVASNERSFSKLKLIKTYLRTSISQERLANLALITIENDTCAELDVKEIISKFVNMKSRKIGIF